MAKKANLAASLDDVLSAPAPAAEARPSARRARPRPQQEGDTVLVGANLPPKYARNLAFLHAETGRSKKELLQEALDDFFVKKGGRNLL